MTDHDHLLLEVVERPAAELSAEAVAWMADALREHVATGEPLESALGVRRYAVLKARRDQHLRRAWLLLEGRPWPRSEELARRIREFESRRWPRVQYELAPPDRFDEVDRHLFRAFRCSVGTPSSGRAMHGICADLISEKHAPANFGNESPISTSGNGSN